jgi:hypothetical protein
VSEVVASPAATLSHGAQVGNYVVDKKIGEGGMGAVYVAVHPSLGRKVAIKVLLPEHSQQPDLVTRFFNEAKTAASLRHPALVEVFDFGQLPNGAAYLVMDFLEGESLAARLTRVKRLSAAEAVEIGRQIAAGVAAAHGQGIVHRDLKPDNVFLVPDPENPGRERVKILDFGIAKLVMPNASLSQGSKAVRTSTGMLLGTPLYMAPEQCRGSGQVDHRADIYSVGCILFMMLTGRPPFNHEGVGEVLAAHLHEPVPPLRSLQAGIPPALEAVVMRALDKKPEQRFQTMAELAAELQRAFATPVAESEPMQVPTQRRGGLIALAAVAVLGAGGVYLWQQRSRPAAPPAVAGGEPKPRVQAPGPVAGKAEGAATGPGTSDHKEGAPASGAGATPPATSAGAGATTGPGAPGSESANAGSGAAPSAGASPPSGESVAGKDPAASGGPGAAEQSGPSGSGAAPMPGGAPADPGREPAADAAPSGGGAAREPDGKAARAGSPPGHLLYEKALDLRARGKEAEALLAYRAALAAGGLTTEERSQAEHNILGLRKKFGELEVICDLDGATVSIDGKIQGRTPLRRPMLLKPGRHTLIITKPGYRTIQKGVELVGGERLPLRFSVSR